MRTGVRVAREMRLVEKRCQFFAVQLFVDLLHLRWESIVAGAAIGDVAGDLRVGFECGADGFDFYLRLIG